MSKAWVVRVLHVLLGGLMLFAGGGKILTLLWPVDSLGWPSWLIVLGGVVETLLGLWLVSGLGRRAAHVAALAVFALLCAFSLSQVIRGVPSCGCLMKLHVPPVWMFTFDVIVTATLAGLAGFFVTNGILAVLAASLMQTGLLRADDVPEECETRFVAHGQSPPAPSPICEPFATNDDGTVYRCCPQGEGECDGDLVDSTALSAYPSSGCTWYGYVGQEPRWCCYYQIPVTCLCPNGTVDCNAYMGNCHFWSYSCTDRTGCGTPPCKGCQPGGSYCECYKY